MLDVDEKGLQKLVRSSLVNSEEKEPESEKKIQNQDRRRQRD